MLTLNDFLGLLPDIKPLKTRQLILDGDLLDAGQRRDIRDRNRSVVDLVMEVGPDAATAIVAAYKAGQLPMKTAKTRPSAVPEADAYLDKAPEHRRQIAERERLQQAIKDPSLLTEADLDNYRLLDSLFFAIKGPGSGTLELAGITVTKRITDYSSNSGKSRGWRVWFSWTGSDGRQHALEKVPPEAHNRRNDPERNWGLHE